jgi:hypothetical protein
VAVKGLEYDGCLVADPHGIVEESQHPVAGLRSLYVALPVRPSGSWSWPRSRSTLSPGEPAG